MKKIKGWALLNEKNDPTYPLFHTKKEAIKERFTENIGKLEIRIIKIIPFK